MIRMNQRARRLRPGRDDGQVSAFVVTITLALLALAGLGLDGGLALAAKVKANGHAEAAARAGAQALDLAQYRESGQLHLIPAQAAAEARGYLGRVGASGTVTVTVSGNTVTVKVTASQPTQLLGLIGVSRLQVHGEGSAHPQRGVTTAEPRPTPSSTEPRRSHRSTSAEGETTMATTDIATAQEIRRRVDEADTVRRERRAAAAQQVGELARQRAIHASKVEEFDRQLAEVIAGSRDVMDIDELARFTSIRPAELTGWLNASKPARTKKKSLTTGKHDDPSREPSAAGTTTNGQAVPPPRLVTADVT